MSADLSLGSVWPAYWTQGIDDWPTDGEIDIMENVNVVTQNRYALHTTQGCTHPAAGDSANLQTGTVISTDCYNATNGDEVRRPVDLVKVAN